MWFQMIAVLMTFGVVMGEPTLWERMGGEVKIRPLCNDLYAMHATDPLTAKWFGDHVPGNRRTADEVKEHVFTFFSAGIGGPHTYKGNDMKAAHAHMKIDRHAFHALTNHVMVAMAKHNTGGSKEREEVHDILMSLRPDVMHGTPTESLWERMGGEAKIRPLCNDLYEMHATDPLTAKWFGKHVPGNKRTADEVKEHVFTFFSAGIGGPHAYKGSDMKAAHAHMKIDRHAFHALTNHVTVAMEKHKTGGPKEREEVHDILMSLRPDVMHSTESEPIEMIKPTKSLWERMGGEKAIRPLCNDLYKMHSTDPLTAKWFGEHVPGNRRTADEVKEHVFTFFSAGIGGPHAYEGNNMKAAHAHMKIDRHAFHALTNHVTVAMEKHKTGGPKEREEVHDILMSLRPDVMHGTKSLWERMGGEAKIRPLCNDLYEMHATDPLTAKWFGEHVPGNKRTANEVKEHVFTFFSAGIGGPHSYKGSDMKTAHAHMKIDRHAFHALTNHVMVAMAKHNTGGPAEREEVYDILMSLRPDVMHGTNTLSFSTIQVVGATAIFGVVFGLLIFWRQTLALDSANNNSGIFQWSSMFYTTGGAITDFVNASPYIINLAPTATVFLGIYLRAVTGNDWFTFTTFVVGFGAVPLADLVIGEDSYNPTPEEESALRNNWWFSFHLCAYVWAYIGSLIAIAYYVGVESGFLGGGPDKMSMTALSGIAISLGISSGFGIGCIHELIHRPSFVELYHARAVLLFSNFNHFWVEHLWGHHKRVATDMDPASSAINEPLWTFIFKCWYYSFLSACRLEAKFLSNRGLSWLSLHNRILYPFIASFLIDYIIYKCFGPKALFLQIVQSIGTAFLTDNANYIEHYGLRRKRLSEKTDDWGWHNDYERPGWMHAWNTGDRITNWMLFKIERHPDHHVNAGRPYQILRTFKESPTYPTGYAGMILLSWFPPCWFAVMNPLVRKAQDDYTQQLADGSYDKLFPKGANNISTVYKRIGEDFYEPGSSEYSGGKDADTSGQGVWSAKKCD